MKLTFYCLGRCTTCKKAHAALLEDGHEVDYIDVRKDGVPPVVLAEAMARLGKDKVVNRRSLTWRKLSETERQMDPVELLGAHPTLMKRPLIVSGSHMSVGWSDEIRSQLAGLGGSS